MPKILITGGTGFAGKHLIQALKALKTTPKSHLDIYGTCFPDRPAPSDNNLFFLDIRSEEDVKSIIRRLKPDWVFHLAAVSNVGYSWKNRTETLEINIIGTHNLLEAARLFSPRARILFVSSSDVYKFDKNKKQAVSEKAPLEIKSPYAYSKLAAEMLCKFYVEVEGLDLVVARPFPHTGPGQSEQFVCSDWAKQIAEIEAGKKPPVIEVGNLEVVTDYCDVRDVVKAYILLLKKGKKGQVYNISTGRPISLKDILNILIKEARIKGTIKIKKDPTKLRTLDLAVRLGKNNKIKNELGWKPEIPIEQSLRDLLDYWRHQDSIGKIAPKRTED